MEPNDDSGVSVQTVKPDEADSSIVASSSPVVFQCSQCNAIVGDSTVWVTSNKVMRTITLGRVTNKVDVESSIKVSETGIDKGSTYSRLFCISCKEDLGKQYMASPPDLDYIRGRYTFNVEKLNSYLIGSAQKAGNFDLADMLNVPSPYYFMARMNKMQFLIVSLNDRIKNLETAVSSGESVPKQSTPKQAEDFNRQSLQTETESVSSTDHISTDVRSESFHSGDTECVTLQEEDNYLSREESLLPWQTSKENLNFDRAFDQQRRESLTRNSVVSEQRSINRFAGPRSAFQPVNTRLEQDKNMISPDRNSMFSNNKNVKETDNVYRGNGRKVSSDRTINQISNDRGSSQRDRQGHQQRAQGQNTNSQRSNWNNAHQHEKNYSRNELTSPSRNSVRSVSRKHAVMETWSSPGVEKTGREVRESKKRKM